MFAKYFNLLMMILTMKGPDAPATATGHETISAGKVCASTKVVDSGTNKLRSTSGSCNSLTSSCSSSTSSTETSSMLKGKKRVSFSLQQTAYFSPEQALSREERKSECWYSEAELNVSRDEARTSIQALHHQLQLDAAAAARAIETNVIEPVKPVTGKLGSWCLRCPEDQTKVLCLRGIEKYADAAAKYAGQKRLVNSVLQQQSINKEDAHVSLVSMTLSQPFKDVARYYAMKSAEELDLSTKLEQEQEETDRKQREEAASVLFLLMGQENKGKEEQQQLFPKTPSQLSSPKRQEKSPVVTPRGSIARKRSSFTDSPLRDGRNVKSCIRTITN
jgi:hypothetical protein